MIMRGRVSYQGSIPCISLATAVILQLGIWILRLPPFEEKNLTIIFVAAKTCQNNKTAIPSTYGGAFHIFSV